MLKRSFCLAIIMWLFFNGLGQVLATDLIGNKAKANEEVYSAHTVVYFNPSGTRVIEGRLYIRLDIYPTENMTIYSSQRVWNTLQNGFVTNPMLCVFVGVSTDTTKQQLEDYISNSLSPDNLRSISDTLILSDSVHRLSPFMRDKVTINGEPVIGDLGEAVNIINQRFDGFSTVANVSDVRLPLPPETITIGSAATNRAGNVATSLYTVINVDDAASDNGTLDTIEIWCDSASSNMSVMTFYNTAGNDYKIRDSHYLGAVASGSKQTFAGITNFNVVAGDLLGCTDPIDVVSSLSRDGTASKALYYTGHIYTIDDEETFSLTTGPLSLYGSGPESAAVPSVTSVSSFLVTQTSATLTGNLTSIGSENCTTRIIEWGTSTGVYSANETENGNFSIGAWTANITGQDCGDEIFWRAKAYNSVGWGYGSEKSFNTLACDVGEPIVGCGYVFADDTIGTITWANIPNGADDDWLTYSHFWSDKNSWSDYFYLNYDDYILARGYRIKTLITQLTRVTQMNVDLYVSGEWTESYNGTSHTGSRDFIFDSSNFTVVKGIRVRWYNSSGIDGQILRQYETQLEGRGIPSVVDNFTATRYGGGESVYYSWNRETELATDNYTIRCRDSGYPSLSNGWEVWSGNLTSVNITYMPSGVIGKWIGIWSWNGCGYSDPRYLMIGGEDLDLNSLIPLGINMLLMLGLAFFSAFTKKNKNQLVHLGIILLAFGNIILYHMSGYAPSVAIFFDLAMVCLVIYEIRVMTRSKSV